MVQEAHRRNARVTIHSRGANFTRAAAEAGVDWILHADMATEADLDAVAEAGVRIMPTMTFLRQAAEFGHELGRSDREVDAIERHFDGAAGVLERARSLGIKVLCGTDSGNSPVMPYGELHANEPEIMVRYGGYTPMEAIVACTRDNAFVVELEGEVGEIRPRMLADIIILRQDPIGNIGILKGGHNLVRVIKDGKTVDLNGHQAEDALLELQETLV